MELAKPGPVDPISLLEVRGLTLDFGGLRALDGVDCRIASNEIVALIGPNGAGKTTFFNCITGIYTPTAGDILLPHQPSSGGPVRLNGKKPNQITELGVARTFQNIRLFGEMTVLENVMIGRHCRTSTGVLGAILRSRATRAEEEEIVRRSRAILDHVGIGSSIDEPAKNLPYGMQRRLEIARALATEPKLLLLDEPAAGMNPQETRELDQLITKIREEDKIAVLLIEHDMKLVMSISDRVVVMDYGRKIAEGTPAEIRANPAVIKAYLGEG